MGAAFDSQTQKMSRLGPVGHALNTSLCLSSASEVILAVVFHTSAQRAKPTGKLLGATCISELVLKL